MTKVATLIFPIIIYCDTENGDVFKSCVSTETLTYRLDRTQTSAYEERRTQKSAYDERHTQKSAYGVGRFLCVNGDVCDVVL